MPSKIVIIRNDTAPKIEISKTGNRVSINRSGHLINLPVASESELGGIKVGANLSISNGVLNASAGEGGAGDWGSIGGDIGEQTDLQSELDAKADISGTPSANQIGIWNDGTGIKGDSKVTWNGTTLVIDGIIASTGNIVAYYTP